MGGDKRCGTKKKRAGDESDHTETTRPSRTAIRPAANSVKRGKPGKGGSKKYAKQSKGGKPKRKKKSQVNGHISTPTLTPGEEQENAAKRSKEELQGGGSK